MGDDERALERVGRSHRSGLWIGAWVLGLAAVVAMAVAGRQASAHDPTLIPEAVVSPSEAPVAVASPAVRGSPRGGRDRSLRRSRIVAAPTSADAG